jgi:hypothetical protein
LGNKEVFNTAKRVLVGEHQGKKIRVLADLSASLTVFWVESEDVDGRPYWEAWRSNTLPASSVIAMVLDGDLEEVTR